MNRPASPLRALLFALLVACGGGDGTPDATVDAAVDAPDSTADASPDAAPEPASTAHCDYETQPSTAGSGGAVTSGAIQAGTAEGILHLPIGSGLGGYTARADFMGSVTWPDRRFTAYSGSFKASVGVETWPRVRAVAITAGDETVVLLKADVIHSDELVLHDVTERLGSDYRGKVLFTTSHSHSAWGHYVSNTVLQIGSGRRRNQAHDRLVDDLVAAAEAALAARAPAQLGFAHDGDFDPENRVSRDRRSENDSLPNGVGKDHDLFVLRIDHADGSPMALLPMFGIHGTILGESNPLASTDAIGAIERALEESFDEEVLVMHLQGSAGDVSPSGTGGIDCRGAKPCYDFARAESVGHAAREAVLAAWTAAGDAMITTAEMEMLGRSVELGPDWDTFSVRGGSLTYAPMDGVSEPDLEIFDAEGNVISPIDEFNAPVGAALCGEEDPAIFLLGQLPGTRRAQTAYRSCVTVDVAAEILGEVMVLPFEEAMPACATTRTMLSALRIDDHVIVMLPGEPVTLFSDRLRAASPVSADNTIVLGYSQDHVGYLLTAEDWLEGGFEPTINMWGPLEGELISEQAEALMAMVMTPEREDGAEGAATRSVPPAPDDTDILPAPDPAPMAGTVPAVPWEKVYVRGGEALTQGQPAATVPRLGLVTFSWIGEDPMMANPLVTLERETAPGSDSWQPVTRRSGRAVVDQDFLLTHTPEPLFRDGEDPRTHHWAIEWQAVGPWGTEVDSELIDRVGIALGRYRFHVVGAGYELMSSPVEVLVGTVVVADATVTGTAVGATVSYHADDGFRLLHATRRSNDAIPLAEGVVDVELVLGAGGVVTFAGVATDADGAFSVDAAGDAGDVVAVRVRDGFDNAGEGAL